MIWLQSFRRYIFPLVIFCILPVLLGGAIYLLFRSDSSLMFAWIKKLGFDGELQSIREVTIPFSRFIPQQVIFSAPDALWTFSLVWFLEIVWNEKNDNRLTNRILVASAVIAVGYECIQYFYRNLGWFSFNDVLWISASLAAFKLIRIMNNAE